ncbi:DUF2946 family protein [Xanthobacter sp. KR7-225]|uniref:DUF2946 family protein n=1 Tax=Xanthobacter sp. KR7-225 TaxID=3156613 RepID=UPI0032B31C54
MAAWAAAYALVFQLVLASALVAAMPRDASGTPICAAARLAGDADQGEKGKGAAVHCPVCLMRVDAAALPPPFPVAAAKRVALAVTYVPPAPLPAPRAPGWLPSQPRAPPLLG